MNISELLDISPIVPVVVIEDVEAAIDLASCIKEAGINIIEVTLRTPDALKAIERIRSHVDIRVGAGTITRKEDVAKALDAGSEFLFSPGITADILDEVQSKESIIVPGVFSPSDVMLALSYDIALCKLFPANLAGGTSTLKLYHSLFSTMKFCPTGGISYANIKEYLEVENVAMVGGSFIAPAKAITQRDFDSITQNITKALDAIK